MLSSKLKVKKETRVAKVGRKTGHFEKAIESTVRSSTKHIGDASQVSIPCVVQSRCDIHTAKAALYVPVVDNNNQPLMPTTPSRARRWIKSGRATPFFKLGVFCVRINEDVGNNKQSIVIGIDTGSKREALTVKAKAHTFLNVLSETPTWVKDAVEQKRNARRARRQRKTPCRKNKYNRVRGGLPPSTKARWQSKLRIVNKLGKILPITNYVVEDIQAKTMTNGRKWNVMFSPLQVGKKWFYSELEKLGKLELCQGYETKELRDNLGLKKSKAKLDDKFECHNVDSWVMANDVVGGHTTPDNKNIIKIIPMQFHRRQLHMFQPSVNNVRKTYGSTMSLGFKRGSIVKHQKYKICYVGGTKGDRISLHNLEDGSRLCQNAKPSDIKFLTYNTWKMVGIPPRG
jgi:hypothetical protein